MMLTVALYSNGNNIAKIRNYLPATALIFNDFALFIVIYRHVYITCILIRLYI